jgi:hypothetical protein
MPYANMAPLVSLAVVACAMKPTLPTEPQLAVEPRPAEVVAVESIDPCADRSLEDAVHEARAALDAGGRESAQQLGLAVEQALACEVRARRWQLELDAVSLLARLDPLPEPSVSPCKLDREEGVCVYVYSERKRPPKEEPAPAPIYGELALARLDAYARYEADATPGEALRSISDRHIRLRLHHQDFEAALPLLQNYVVDYHEHDDAVRAAMLLVDTHVMTWSIHGDEHAYRGTSMLAWFDRLATLAFWNDPAAAELHQRIAELRPGAMWRTAMEARDEGADEVRALVAASLPAGEKVDRRQFRAGHKGREIAGFRRCAELFLEIHAAYPDHDMPDTLLWNAADCYDANYDLDLARGVRLTLLDRYPESAHYQDTLYYVAEAEHQVARYDEAEDHYLEYVRRYYPKDSYRSADALLFAHQLGAALGHDTSKLADEYVRREKKRDLSRTGYFVWQTRPKDPRRLAEFANEYLREFGFKIGLPSYAAEQVSAEAQWADACRGRLDDDLCVERRTANRIEQCPFGGVPLPDFRARAGKRGEEARMRIRGTAKRAKGLRPPDRWDIADAEAWAAELQAASALLVLEPQLEDYLVAGPEAPDARERAKQLDARYLEVVALGHVEVAIRAHARRGLIWEALASPDLRSREGDCVPITAWAEGDRKRALAGYDACLSLAIEHQHFSDAARRCEAKLATEEPSRVPPLVELFGEPGLLPLGEIEMTGVVEAQ